MPKLSTELERLLGEAKMASDEEQRLTLLELELSERSRNVSREEYDVLWDQILALRPLVADASRRASEAWKALMAASDIELNKDAGPR